MQSSLRMTWQASPRNKIAGTYKVDRWCICPNGLSALRAPETAVDFRFPRLRQSHGEWTSPVTNRLLLEVVGLHLYERWGNMHPQRGNGSMSDQNILDVAPRMIPVVEQSSGLTYRMFTNFNNTQVPNFAYRAAASYVTGTHNFKVGFNRVHGFQKTYSYTQSPVAYRFNNGVPNEITLRAEPRTVRNHQDNDFGVYAQDRWTMNRWTLNLALRYDFFKTSFPEQRIGPGELVPTRDIVFPEQENTAWHDLTYRTALSYDVFGTGKTAVKVTFNKYLRGQTLNLLGGADTNPANAMVVSTTRSWADANGDYTPQCNVTLPAGNGECGPMVNANFGTTVPGATFDPDLLRGFGNRERNWEFSAGLQQELLPRVAVDVGYFRRIWGNFRVTDNLLVGPDDFDRFSMTVPQDSRLPGGGGYRVEGLYAIKPSAFGRVQDLNTLDRKYGTQIEHWDGIDVNASARLQGGLTLQLGMSTGKTTEDDCEIVSELPELLNFNPLANGNSPPALPSAPTGWRPAQWCHRETPWLTQVKGYAVYTLPRVDVQVSGTLRNVTGEPIRAVFNASNAYLAANSTLGRPLAGGAANLPIDIVEPNTVFLDRRNEVDLRFGKMLRRGRTRTVLSVDLFNALNTDAVVNANQNFAVWQRPTQILNARLVKFSVQFDY
jgi:hypothetical protein